LRHWEVIGPHRTGLEKMGIGVDHDSWHRTTVEKDQQSCVL
jgi:hypothetical protein